MVIISTKHENETEYKKVNLGIIYWEALKNA